MTRLAINPDWSCNTRDPRNARYLRTLSVAIDEEMASCMAEVIYGAVAEQHTGDPTFNRSIEGERTDSFSESPAVMRSE